MRKILGILLLSSLCACACSRARTPYWARPESASKVDMAERAEELKKLRFGMFICWSFSTFSDQEWTRGVENVAFFNPSGVDTDQWARVARDAGMGYILFLTKHHDGFCLWDTETTDWKVTNSPLGIDVLAALRKSCDKYGIKLALYFSEGDWTRPENKDAELKKAQLRELCTQYGPIEYFWMDHAQSDGGLSHKETVEWVKQFQPGCFVGFNHGEVAGDIRLGEMGQPGPLDSIEGSGYNKSISEDYLLAEFALPILGKGGRWFYTNGANDTAALSAESIFELVRGAAHYGNIFSLDVGPGRDGRLRPIDIEKLEAVGRMIRNAPDGAVAAPFVE